MILPVSGSPVILNGSRVSEQCEINKSQYKICNWQRFSDSSSNRANRALRGGLFTEQFSSADKFLCSSSGGLFERL